MTLQVGAKAPDVKLQAMLNGQFQEISLSEIQKQGKWTVLFFYPLDFTFVCPTEINAFSDQYGEFQKLGAEVLGCSVDSQFSHLAWSQKPRNQGGIEGIRYPLLADVNKQLAQQFGVLIEGKGVALRGAFIIDPTGTVQYAAIHNLPVGRSVDETLRVLKAFQFAATSGEVCPANWDEGKATMKPDPKGSQEYFGKVAAAK